VSATTRIVLATLEHLSWSSNFMVNLAVVVILIGRLTVPSSPVEAAGGDDRFGASACGQLASPIGSVS